MFGSNWSLIPFAWQLLGRIGHSSILLGSSRVDLVNRPLYSAMIVSNWSLVGRGPPAGEGALSLQHWDMYCGSVSQQSPHITRHLHDGFNAVEQSMLSVLRSVPTPPPMVVSGVNWCWVSLAHVSNIVSNNVIAAISTPACFLLSVPNW